MTDTALTDRVRQAMKAAGAARSAELQDICQASQPSISRALAPLLAAGEVLRIGRARSQAYVMPRLVDGIGGSALVPVMRVDELGEVTPFGTLIPVTGSRYWMEEEGGAGSLHAGLPWFITDMRPQGFLGRAFAQAHPQLQLAANPDHWTDDDVLKALCAAGSDLPGNLLVGAASFDRFLQAQPPERVESKQFPDLADAAMRGALPGSSAGGEQPKFCVVGSAGKPVIVKFSPAGESAVEVRWRDLLICEHIALETLGQGEVEAARSTLSSARGRAFLEIERFDRTANGRIGMVSLLAYDAEHIGQMDNWAATATRMASRNLLQDADADRLKLLEAFGRLIGNTDRHYGNISLLIRSGSWSLAPAYDMLPMIYAPINGELIERDFDPAALRPTVDTLRQWTQAVDLALRYWKALAKDKRLSPGFRSRCALHAGQLAAAN
ncbi:type II toxin-antitoxin system HipA family toxin YjjJ [Caenimonas sp. SL110]|uniref:type II toxin-antitoxin system HipA family toxin YjjJ n=1 Tax=Caenimonas sp. SL110 TaxID=1450524 RepID=UPI00065484C9|nr:type II toxin-antitoxin system HipA family toxin YjjJ [Caenimonas sp. SL110]